MNIMLAAIVGLLCIICFVTGARVGQKVQRGEEIKPPAVNPIKAYREHEAKKEAQREQSRIDVILRNIENYNGTESGQADVPRG